LGRLDFDKFVGIVDGKRYFPLGLMMRAGDIDTLVAEQFARISQPDVVKSLRPLLVKPRCEQRPWDYGTPDQTYPCWIVAEHRPSNTAIAFCESGFGPSCPWGLLFLNGPHLNMGMDSQWFISLEEAFRDSMAWEGENPPGYQVS
jgi:hypothetical protein